MAWSEYRKGAPRLPVAFGRQCSRTNSSSNQTARLPRSTRARSYSRQFVTRYCALTLVSSPLGTAGVVMAVLHRLLP
jgi:hypothetical protein